MAKKLLPLLALCLSTSACQSSKVFELKTFPAVQKSGLVDLHVIQVNSNRVQQKCLFFDAEAENNWRHQYLMYALNDKNEVFEIMQPTNQDKETCDAQIQKIEKVLRTESQVKICVRDELKKYPEASESQHKLVQFGSLGDHKVAYESLTLDSICNSKSCFSNNALWVNTCSGFEKH